ncbi:hypothetical protein IKP85_02685 [bacterium]|nr:hypothetical protein [bacterium]
MEKILKAEKVLQTKNSRNEFDVSDLEDIEPYNNSKESYDFNFEREDLDKKIPEVNIDSVRQQSSVISFDFIKLLFPLTYSREARFSVNRHCFFRTNKPRIPARSDESILVMYAEEKHYQKMILTDNERRKLKTEEYENDSLKRAKLIFPNAKPFYNDKNQHIGLGHMYFADGNFIISISGKIVSANNFLGLLTNDTIDRALNEIKSTGLVKFDNNIFKKYANILSSHVTNDLLVPSINTSVRAFSSYLPMRTDKYNVLKYSNSGYEVIARGRQSKQVPKYEFCIYNKGLEIREHNQKSYIKRIGSSGISLANNTLRMELRLLNFHAIRKFLAPNLKKGTLTLNELLTCEQRPIIEMLNLLNIKEDSLRGARGKYITMVESDTSPTQAEFERMHGLIRLLELHDYNLDRVRSYTETETGRKTHSTYFSEKRDILQRYITCYMPQTVATLTELLAGMSY